MANNKNNPAPVSDHDEKPVLRFFSMLLCFLMTLLFASLFIGLAMGFDSPTGIVLAVLGGISVLIDLYIIYYSLKHRPGKNFKKRK